MRLAVGWGLFLSVKWGLLSPGGARVPALGLCRCKKKKKPAAVQRWAKEKH